MCFSPLHYVSIVPLHPLIYNLVGSLEIKDWGVETKWAVTFCDAICFPQRTASGCLTCSIHLSTVALIKQIPLIYSFQEMNFYLCVLNLLFPDLLGPWKHRHIFCCCLAVVVFVWFYFPLADSALGWLHHGLFLWRSTSTVGYKWQRCDYRIHYCLYYTFSLCYCQTGWNQCATAKKYSHPKIVLIWVGKEIHKCTSVCAQNIPTYVVLLLEAMNLKDESVLVI